jgi:hypothetical protein
MATACSFTEGEGRDLFAAIDLLLEKMDRQIIKFKEKSQSHKGVRNEIPDSLIFESFDESINRNIRLNQVSNKPLNRIEAYLQMKNDKRDFMLFKQGWAKLTARSIIPTSATPRFSGIRTCAGWWRSPLIRHPTVLSRRLHGICS